jgi:hypothetical protein
MEWVAPTEVEKSTLLRSHPRCRLVADSAILKAIWSASSVATSKD